MIGTLTSLYREADALVQSGDVEVVSQRVQQVEDAFLRFSRSHYEYYNTLVDSRDQEQENQYYNDQLQRKSAFILKMKAWINERRVRPDDSVSNISFTRSVRSVTSSVAVKRLKANEALARMEIEQLKFRQDLLRQEEELKLQRQMLEAQYRLQKAQLEVTIYNENDEYSNYDQEFEQNMNHDEFDECHGELPNQPKVNTGIVHDIKPLRLANEYPSELPNPSKVNTNFVYDKQLSKEVNDQSEFNNELCCDAEPLARAKIQSGEAQAMTYNYLAQRFHLPKPELTSFDGDPLEYWNFIRSFENYIERNAANESVKLMYLLQYTTGDAKRIIKSCAMMDPSKGYKTARQLLQERCGHPFTIATKCVSKLIDGPPLKPSDRAGLLLFADELTNCQNILEAIGYLQEINSADNLRRIVQRLPLSLRAKFVEVANHLQQEGQRTTIHHIATFVNQKAKAANDPVFGCLVDQRHESKERPIPKPRTKPVITQRATHQSFTTTAAAKP